MEESIYDNLGIYPPFPKTPRFWTNQNSNNIFPKSEHVIQKNKKVRANIRFAAKTVSLFIGFWAIKKTLLYGRYR